MSDSEVQFNPELHEYSADGVVYPSVTTIISDCGAMGGKQWYTESSRKAGLQRHSLISDYLCDRVDYSKVSEEGFEVLRKLQEFRDSEIEGIFMAEKPLVSVEFGYAGTPDLLYFSKKRERVLVDWKGSSRAEWHRVQLAAYWRLLPEPGANAFGIVYTNPAKWGLTEVENVSYYWEVFLAMLKVYKFKHGEEK